MANFPYIIWINGTSPMNKFLAHVVLALQISGVVTSSLFSRSYVGIVAGQGVPERYAMRLLV